MTFSRPGYLPLYHTARESNPDKDVGRVQEKVSRKPVRILHVEDDLTVAGLVQEIAEHVAWEVKHG